MYKLRVEGAFEAAHRLNDYQGKCANLHGHNWVVEVELWGTELNEIGILIDFKDAKRALNEVLYEFDHRYLNELAPFNAGVNPTAENIARIIYERLLIHSSLQGKAKLKAVTVLESPKSSVTYTAD